MLARRRRTRHAVEPPLLVPGDTAVPLSFPDDPAGPHPRPPVQFVDGVGRSISLRSVERPIEKLGDPPASAVEHLAELYAQFDDADLTQERPPRDPVASRTWLETTLETGQHVVAVHDGLAVGHAMLLPGVETGAHERDRDGGVNSGTASGGGAADPDDGAGVSRSPARSSDAGTVPWELAVFVLGAYQRAGIGTRLVETILGAGAAAGVERVWLTVERWNEPAISVYEGVGFEVIEVGPFELTMAIRLERPEE